MHIGFAGLIAQSAKHINPFLMSNLILGPMGDEFACTLMDDHSIRAATNIIDPGLLDVVTTLAIPT